MTESSIFFYILLLVALAAGWALAQVSLKSKYRSNRSVNDFYNDYFVGLNYLLGDEPDEAIDTFISALEINDDTVETHLALGTLLRRRGKVDKAIKVHQSLLARSDLVREFSDLVQLELSNDYISAGLLDRAEHLAQELLRESDGVRPDALLQLTTIYQIEREWEQAITSVKALLEIPNFKKDESIKSLAAHFCCELAEQAISDEQPQQARDQIKRAFRFDRSSARASFLMAKLEQLTNNPQKAIKELLRIRHQHPHFISEIIGPMAECYRHSAKPDETIKFEKFLRECLDDRFRVSVLLKLVELVRKREGDTAAAELLSTRLSQHPSLKGTVALLQSHIDETDGKLHLDLKLIEDVLNKLSQSKPGYQCDHCGFETKNLYWQCSSCKKWDSVKPRLGLEGE
ncbi:MAG: lipopolysaccharide assembly protein LapB [Gammaproteobacteria bacterium]|nr:lipopolysaccharide assembly protein LapB [Gammaproteobacteria bacterium]